jgi:lysophospholipase L1-like esterase
LNHHTAGGRVRFRTDSKCIAIKAVMATDYLMSHITLIGQSGFDLYHRLEDGRDLYHQSFRPPMGMRTGYESAVMTSGKLRDYTINFPLYDGVKELYIALKKDAVLEAPTPYKHQKPVVYYGSSITQGGCASRPGNSYQGILTRRLDTEHVNLGFSGSGKAEKEMVNYLASLDMSVFVCDYDYNCLSAEYLRQTHWPLYSAVRSAHPQLPIILISAPTSIKEPENFAERRAAVRATYDRAVAEGDQNVYFIDGAELFAGECWDSCTVDGCHPNDFGFYRMAMRIEKTLKPILEKLRG